jgi:uridine kinase
MRRAFVLGIAGGTGSGKSRLARRVAGALGSRAALVLLDWYYRDRSGVRGAARRRLNFDHPRAIEGRLAARHLRALARGEAVLAPRYDYSRHRRLARGQAVAPAPVVVVEGLFALADPAVRRQLDHGIYLSEAADVRLARRVRRDVVERGISVEETLRLYFHCVRPMHERFVEPSRRHADEAWEGGGRPGAVRRLLARLRREARRRAT